MSDISKIQYPDGTIYNIKDANVRNTLDVSRRAYNSIGERMGAYADASEVAADYLEYLQHSHAPEPEFRLTKSPGGVCKPYMTYNEFNSWSDKSWGDELPTKHEGSNIWTDGENVYYSGYDSSSKLYVHKIFDKSISKWVDKTWTGYTNFNGAQIWTDGDNIYLSSGSDQFVLDKSTSTWNTKSWSGITNYGGYGIWTDGTNIYYSSDYLGNYVLNKSTSTWSTKTWTNPPSNFNAKYVWTDGTNIYYSYYDSWYGTSTHCVLNKSTSTWSTKTWTNPPSNFYGCYVWTDGKNIYYSGGSSSDNYILNKSTSTWVTKSWSGITNLYGEYIWTEGENIYYSYNGTNKILDPLTKTTTNMPSCKP